jgi:serine-type D-Ala-D-Ala carboxypeptidase (penicillin-binding protein 5/6)
VLAVTAVAVATGAPVAAGASRAARPGPAPVVGARAQGGPELARGGVVVNYPSAAFPRLPNPQSDAFVVADASTGQILAAENPHTWYGPASTLKILTAISLIPALNPNATTAASAEAVNQEPNDVGLVKGHQYRIADLFRALLLISANDAAVALTEATGSYNRGIALMNAEAHRLQAHDTVAKTPNGLDAAGQHESAYDEALIARQALRTPAFMAYDTTRTAMFNIKSGHRAQLINQDTLLNSYPGFLGGKIGWTTPAKGTYTGMARRNGHTLIVSLLHSVPLTWPSTAPALLDWGFAADGKVRPVGYLANPLPPQASPAKQRPSQHAAVDIRPASAGRGSGISPVYVTVAVLGGLAAVGVIVLAYRLARRW